MNLLNQNADVVAKHSCECFVDLPNGGLAPNGIAKLALHHREGGFHVRAAVIVAHIHVPTEHEVVIHPRPHRIIPINGQRVALEWNEGYRASESGDFKVLVREVRLIRRYFVNAEMLGCTGEQRLKEVSIVGSPSADFNAGNDFGMSAAHQVTLNPFPIALFLAILFVIPTNKSRCAETAGINGEVGFNRLQRQTAKGNEVHEDRDKVRVAQVVGHAVEMWRGGYETLGMCVPQIAGKAAYRETAIDLVCRCKHHIGQTQAWASKGVFRLGDSAAKVCQKLYKAGLFFTLSGVVRRPVLRGIGEIERQLGWFLRGHGECRTISESRHGAKPSVMVRGRKVLAHFASPSIFRTSVSPRNACVKRKTVVLQSIDWQYRRNAIISPFIGDGNTPSCEAMCGNHTRRVPCECATLPFALLPLGVGSCVSQAIDVLNQPVQVVNTSEATTSHSQYDAVYDSIIHIVIRHAAYLLSFRPNGQNRIVVLVNH